MEAPLELDLSCIPSEILGFTIISKIKKSDKAIICEVIGPDHDKYAMKCVPPIPGLDTQDQFSEYCIQIRLQQQNNQSPYLLPLYTAFFCDSTAPMSPFPVSFFAYVMPWAHQDFLEYIGYYHPCEDVQQNKDLIIFIMKQCILGVDALHSREEPMGHFDIKPENFFVMNDCPRHPQILLGDFGLSTLCGPNDQRRELRGTEVYNPPEMQRNEPYGLSADIWALGITFYILIAGRHPFMIYDYPYKYTGRYDYEASLPEFFMDYQWGVVPEFYTLVKSMINTDPNERPTTSDLLALPMFANVEISFDEKKTETEQETLVMIDSAYSYINDEGTPESTFGFS